MVLLASIEMVLENGIKRQTEQKCSQYFLEKETATSSSLLANISLWLRIFCYSQRIVEKPKISSSISGISTSGHDGITGRGITLLRQTMKLQNTWNNCCCQAWENKLGKSMPGQTPLPLLFLMVHVPIPGIECFNSPILLQYNRILVETAPLHRGAT